MNDERNIPAEVEGMAELLVSIERAAAELVSAERQWFRTVEPRLDRIDLPEARPLEDLLQAVTHETAGTLQLALQDIKGLLARMALRSKYRLFDSRQFNRIVAQGWSTGLVRQLRPAHPDKTLSELSELVKALCIEWGRLPRVLFQAQPEAPR